MTHSVLGKEKKLPDSLSFSLSRLGVSCERNKKNDATERTSLARHRRRVPRIGISTTRTESFDERLMPAAARSCETNQRALPTTKSDDPLSRGETRRRTGREIGSAMSAKDGGEQREREKRSRNYAFSSLRPLVDNSGERGNGARERWTRASERRKGDRRWQKERR